MGPITTFLTLLVVLAAAASALLVSTHSLGGLLYLVFYEWTPGLAALITFSIFQNTRAALRWRWLRAKGTFGAYLLPLFYILPVYFAAWIAIPHAYDASSFIKSSATLLGFTLHPGLATYGLFVPLSLTFGLLNRFPYTLGEELGWRGFLAPILYEKHGFITSSLLTGVIWAVWHYPLLYGLGLFSGPEAGGRIGCFTVMVVGLAFVFGWLRLKTGSMWPCVLMHASHNAFLQTLFEPQTAKSTTTIPLTSEFGYGLAITIWLVALVLVFVERHKPVGTAK